MNIYTAPEAINILNHHPQQSVEPPDDNIYKHNQPQYAKKPAKRSYLYEKLKSIFIAQRNSPTEHQSHGNPFYKSWLSFKKGLPSNEDKSGEYDQFLTNFQDVTIPIGIRTPSIRVNVREDQNIVPTDQLKLRDLEPSEASNPALGTNNMNWSKPEINDQQDMTKIGSNGDITNEWRVNSIGDLSFNANRSTNGDDEEKPKSAPGSYDPYPKQFDPNTIDMSSMAIVQNPIYRRNVYLQAIKKRLRAISSKRSELWKAERKLLKDLSTWEKNPYLIGTVTPSLVDDIISLFNKDVEYEQRVSQALKLLVDSLGFVSKRETELINAKKELNAVLTKYNKSKEKKPETNEELQILKERVITVQQSLEVIQFHYDQSISVFARKQFTNFGIELFESCSGLKNNAGNFIKNSFTELEKANADCFTEDLENLRRRRAQQYWSTLPPEDRRNPIKWENLKSGLYEHEDSLLKIVYSSLPTVYSPNSISKYPLNFDEMPHNFGISEESYLFKSWQELDQEAKNQPTDNADQTQNWKYESHENKHTTNIFDENYRDTSSQTITKMPVNTIEGRTINRDVKVSENRNSNQESTNNSVLKLNEAIKQAEGTLEENGWAANSSSIPGNKENKNES
ncbi:Hypothetical protein J6898_05249 [Nakaseomyces glabratus]